MRGHTQITAYLFLALRALRILLIIAASVVALFVLGFGPITALWLRFALVFIFFILLIPEINKILPSRHPLKIILAAILLAFCVILWHQIEMQHFYKKIFKVEIQDPLPVGVKLIRGDRGRWLDPDAYLIFKIDGTGFEQLVRDYKILPPGEVPARLREWPNHIEQKPWEKPGIIIYQKIILGKSGVDSTGKKWQSTYEYFLLRDKDSKQVYFYHPWSQEA